MRVYFGGECYAIKMNGKRNRVNWLKMRFTRRIFQMGLDMPQEYCGQQEPFCVRGKRLRGMRAGGVPKI